MHILIVSPAFAPYSGVGSIRMGSLAKYLVEQGEQITVLRNNPNLWPADSLKSDVPEGINIVDVNAVGNFLSCAKVYQKAIEELNLIFHFDLAICSGGPYYTFTAMKRMKKKYGLSYILDFRDLWAYDHVPYKDIIRLFTRKILQLITSKIEKASIKFADKIVVVTEGDRHTMCRHYPSRQSDIVTIFNGYEEIENFDMEQSENNSNDIAVYGKFGYYAPSYINYFFKAIQKCNEENVNLRIVHIGKEEDNINQILNELNINQKQYFNTGYMDYKEGLLLLKKSRINFMIYIHPTGLGTKIFDYIYVNKPVIAFAPSKIALCEFLRQFDGAFICQTAEQIKNAILKIIQEDIQVLDSRGSNSKYSRRFQNEKFYKIICE